MYLDDKHYEQDTSDPEGSFGPGGSQAPPDEGEPPTETGVTRETRRFQRGLLLTAISGAALLVAWVIPVLRLVILGLGFACVAICIVYWAYEARTALQPYEMNSYYAGQREDERRRNLFSAVLDVVLWVGFGIASIFGSKDSDRR